MKKYYKETFTEFLQRMHMEDEPMVLDDDLPDAFEGWLENQGIDLIIAYAEKWQVEQKIADLDEMAEQRRLSEDIQKSKNAERNSRLAQIY
jgi:hypothetical protein